VVCVSVTELDTRGDFFYLHPDKFFLYLLPPYVLAVLPRVLSRNVSNAAGVMHYYYYYYYLSPPAQSRRQKKN